MSSRWQPLSRRSAFRAEARHRRHGQRRQMRIAPSPGRALAPLADTQVRHRPVIRYNRAPVRTAALRCTFDATPQSPVPASPDGPLAQPVEQWTFNPLVVGSNPTRPTIRFNRLKIASTQVTGAVPVHIITRGCDGNDHQGCFKATARSHSRISGHPALPKNKDRCCRTGGTSDRPNKLLQRQKATGPGSCRRASSCKRFQRPVYSRSRPCRCSTKAPGYSGQHYRNNPRLRDNFPLGAAVAAPGNGPGEIDPRA